jgi:hypothetical protein
MLSRDCRLAVRGGFGSVGWARALFLAPHGQGGSGGGGPGPGAYLRRPSLALGLPCAARVPGPRPNSLHSLRSCCSDRGASQMWKRVSTRAAGNPALLGAASAPQALAHPRLSGTIEALHEVAAGSATTPHGSLRASPVAPQSSGRHGGGAHMRRRGGSPGHEQSSGLFVPGERPSPWAWRGLQGQGSWPRVYSRASTSDSRACLSSTNEVSAASLRAGQELEHRRAVGALAETAAYKRRRRAARCLAAAIDRGGVTVSAAQEAAARA